MDNITEYYWQCRLDSYMYGRPGLKTTQEDCWTRRTPDGHLHYSLEHLESFLFTDGPEPPPPATDADAIVRVKLLATVENLEDVAEARERNEGVLRRLGPVCRNFVYGKVRAGSRELRAHFEGNPLSTYHAVARNGTSVEDIVGTEVRLEWEMHAAMCQ
jgi:hypothetical protein